MTLFYLLPLLVPMPFLFHYFETTQFLDDYSHLTVVTLLFVVVAGLFSIKIEFRYIILANIFSVILSIILGEMFITPPNASWFKPFGMGAAITFTGILIFLGMLIVRYIITVIMFRK
ncbi:hypothetical protein [Alkalibacillus salilacus]|uniref:Uncharacterized protein n=1 Tax=Alkalibacillus salilacus TaxID=284582 RepID=A0ABT9VIG9_9BACI|nr:hypothetical protein [Alkalibacillus salilacus]MDQ0160767.1 hypothetical protein [Alkalibacillus salilacus]